MRTFKLPGALGLALYWAVTCSFLIYLGWRVYGGALVPLDGLLLFLPPVCAVSLLFSSRSAPKRPAARWERILGKSVLSAIALFFLCYIVFGGRYTVNHYQILLLLLLLAIWEIPYKRAGRRPSLSRFFLLMFTLYLLAALAFCATVRPATVRQGAARVRDAGFTNVQYASSLQETHLFSTAFLNGAAIDQPEMGCYLYSAERDGESYLAAVSVRSGAVAGWTQNAATISVFCYNLREP